MPSIIDVIAPPVAACQTFTVNNAGDSVTATVPAGPYYARNAAGRYRFNKGDSLKVLSMGLKFPESFTSFHGLYGLDTIQIDPYGFTSGALYTYPNFALSMNYVPFENYETVLDVFFDCAQAVGVGPGLLNENYYLSVVPNALIKVSMLGVPATLNTKVFYLVPFLKVLHSLPML